MNVSIFELHQKEMDRVSVLIEIMERKWRDRLAEREMELRDAVDNLTDAETSLGRPASR